MMRLISRIDEAPRATARRARSSKLKRERLPRDHAIFPMTARRKKKKQAEPTQNTSVAEKAPVHSTSNEAGEHERKHRLLASFTVSFFITLALFGLNWCIEERTDFGKGIKEMTYGLLQHFLSNGETALSARVVVLDISGIPMVPSMGFHEENITDRVTLSKIVQLLAAVDPKPLAIGLDVDFSPDARGFADPGDSKIFDSFLELEKDRGVAVRVGVHRSVDLGPDKWLRDPQYMKLASCVVVPTPEKGQSTRYMPEWLEIGYSEKIYEGLTARCPVMGVALAEQVLPGLSPFASWLLESAHQQVFQSSPQDGIRLISNEFLVDYSPLDFLDPAPEIRLSEDGAKLELVRNENASPTGGVPAPDLASTVGKKIVLLGRTKNTVDTFTVPGRPEMPYAGVYLHACAAYTLLNHTLYTLAAPMRLSADFLISMAILALVYGLRWKNRNERYDEFFEHYLPLAIAAVIVLAVVVCETWLLHYTRLMWDDFILVAVVLLLHSPIERIAVAALGWLKRSMHSWRSVPAAAPGPHSGGE